MPLLPHNFPTLRQAGNGNHRPSVLLLGAGMSHNVVPMPGALLADKRADAEAKLGYTSALPLLPSPPATHLYEWADEIMTQLIANGDPNPKLTLAESLDIPQDSRWLGCVSTQRNTPRHRVIARFAREGLWDQIWSLNWDCVQESAFENVGIKRHGQDDGMPWTTVFNVFLTAAQCAQMGEQYSIRVIKPHGCVMGLVDAQQARDGGNNALALDLSERFLITATELASLAPSAGGNAAQQFIFATLCVKLCSHPFVVAGWSASEKYLIDYMNANVRPQLMHQNRQPPLAVDELSVIDREFNGNGHTQLASFYGKNAASAHIHVEQAGLTTNQFFLWLQALYAVGRLDLHANVEDKTAIAELTAMIGQPIDVSVFIIDWVDNFLPVWVRLCWRCGLVMCNKRDGQAVASEDIDLESRDEHIPWNLPNLLRPELKTAARLLAALQRSGSADEWDYEKFPGGLYRNNQLVIPLPVWNGPPPNDLRGLKALIDAIGLHGAGCIDNLAVVFLGLDPAIGIQDKTKLELKELVASNLVMARFARGDDIEEIELEDI
jgi:hypothetical protein